MGFLATKDSIKELVKQINNKFVKKGEYSTSDINVASNRSFNAGQKGNTAWSGFSSWRLCDNKQIEASYGVGSDGTNGYAQMFWGDSTSNLSTRLLLNYDNFFPEYNNRVNLGTNATKFKNGYFTGSVFMGNDSTVNASSTNEYGVLNFKSNDNALRYGYVGKGTSDNNDMQVRAIYSNLEISAVGENAVKVGGATYHVYTHFGSKEWRLAPNSASSGAVHLGTSTERFNTLYCTKSPNVSSDKNLKEGIVYVNDKSNLRKKKQVIHNDDFYSFIKDDLKITKYNYKQTRDDIKDDVKTDILGFIAQDIAENNKKISDILLTQNENGEYSYDMSTYITILAGALQKSINEIESLKQDIEILKAP